MVKFLDLHGINERFRGEMDAAARRVLDSGWYLLGDELKKFQAAFLRVKLPHLDADNARRAEIAARYCAEIKNPLVKLPGLPRTPSLPHSSTPATLPNVWHVYPVRTERRDEFVSHLAGRGIQTVIHYPIPPHRQPAYVEWHGLSLPITELIHDTIVSLPISPVLTDAKVGEVVSAVNDFR